MQSLKHSGTLAIQEVVNRARKIHAMNRIQSNDLMRLEDVLHEALAVIANMPELDANGEDI